MRNHTLIILSHYCHKCVVIYTAFVILCTLFNHIHCFVGIELRQVPVHWNTMLCHSPHIAWSNGTLVAAIFILLVLDEVLNVWPRWLLPRPRNLRAFDLRLHCTWKIYMWHASSNTGGKKFTQHNVNNTLGLTIYFKVNEWELERISLTASAPWYILAVNTMRERQNGRHFRRRHFQMDFLEFLECKCMNFDQHFTELCS